MSKCFIDIFLCYSCSIDVDECSSNPCLHGGRCIDLIGQYQCDCSVRFPSSSYQLYHDDKLSNFCIGFYEGRSLSSQETGYSGINCTSKESDTVSTCFNNGVKHPVSGKCSCLPGNYLSPVSRCSLSYYHGIFNNFFFVAWFGCSLEVMISIYISYNIMHIKYLRFYISVFLYLWVKCWVLWRIYWVRVWGPSGWMSAQFLWREWTLYWWHRQLHLCLHGKKIHSVVKFICEINKNNQEHFAHVSVHIFCKYKLVCQSLAVKWLYLMALRPIILKYSCEMWI